MNCLEFLSRLDAGDTTSLDADARAHAGSCEACRTALANAATLEAALGAHLGGPASVPAPADFVDRLMARVERTPQARFGAAEVARATLAAFATPPIAAAGIGAVALLGLAAAYGFDPRRMSSAVDAAAAPAARLLDALLRPLPATGLAHDVTLAAVACAALPLFAVLLAGAWQLGNLIGDRAPRAL